MRKRIQDAAETITQETGIDFKKYDNPETAEKIGNLLNFYGMANRYIFQTMIVSFIVLCSICYWFYTQQMNLFGIVLFFSFGFFLCIIESVLIGIMRLVGRSVQDGTDLIRYLLDLVLHLHTDLVGDGDQKSRITVSQLFCGLSYSLLIPTIHQVIHRELSILAKPVSIIIENTVFYFTRSLSAMIELTEKSNKRIDKNGDTDHSNRNEDLEDQNDTAHINVAQLLEDIRGKLDPMAESIGRKVSAPARLLFYLVLFIGLPILFVIYKLFL